MSWTADARRSRLAGVVLLTTALSACSPGDPSPAAPSTGRVELSERLRVPATLPATGHETLSDADAEPAAPRAGRSDARAHRVLAVGDLAVPPG